MDGGLYPAPPLVWTPFGWVPLAETVFPPGTKIRIGIPVTSRCTSNVKTFVVVRVYEGSVLTGHGKELKKINSTEYTIAPGETHTFSVERTTEKGSIDRRDIGVEVRYYKGGAWVVNGSKEWDDVYYVREEYLFEIGTPTVTAA